MSADRELVFGFLALQNDCVSRDDLIAGVQVWMQDKSKPLAEILVQRKSIDADACDLLQRLTERHLKRHGEDPQKSLAVLSSLGPLKATLTGLADPDVDASLAAVNRNSSGNAPMSSDVDSDATYIPRRMNGRKNSDRLDAVARFHILRPHARGGLGEVFVARDEELNREVALKEIQRQFADDSDRRSRFVLEAEVTGGLEHPGIVPVYGLGQYADGRPFYAMRFIKGDSLKEAIECFHAKYRGVKDFTTGEVSVEFRHLLGRFIDVCQAIEYAHSRGVLHRDLKPGNIMLGKYGETLVVDWGLAKAVGRKEFITASDENALIPRSGSSIEKTGDGSVIGTPAYMSPEQAAGKLDELSPATDVYSLGATLYQLLTGHSPVRGGGLADVLKQIQSGDIPAPISIMPNIPKPLDAVCRKALSFRAHERYLKASELAAELERYLADEPVTALKEPFTIRARRWVKRHQTVVSSTAAAVLMATVALSVLIVVVSNTNASLLVANTNLARAQRLADAKRIEAELNRKLADRRLYNGDMSLVRFHWESSRVSPALELLERYRPRNQNTMNVGPGDIDAGHQHVDDEVRGFEWFYWDRQRQSELLTVKGHTDYVMGLAFGPDGKQLALAGLYGEVKVFDSTDGRELLSLNAMDSVLDLAFSPDGKQLAGGDAASGVQLWNATTGEELLTLTGHTERVAKVVFSPNGQLLASGSYNGEVKVWDTTTGKESFTLKGHADRVMSLVFSPDGQRLVSASHGEIILWDAMMGQISRTLKGHSGSVACESFSRDGDWLASGSFDGEVKVWNATTGQEAFRFKGHTSTVKSLAFSVDGRRLASASDDGTLKVWDVTTGDMLFSLTVHEEGVGEVVFSPDGTRLASVSRSAYDKKGNPTPGEVKLWDATTGQEAITLIGETALTWNVAFGSDEIRVAYTSRDGTVNVRNALTGQELLSLKGDTERVWSVAFSTNDRQLASARLDGVVQLWDAITGEELFTFNGHTGAVSSVVFSPDNRRLASASWDGTIKIWDTETGQEAFTLNGREGNVTTVAFSPDGLRLASGFLLSGVIKVWDTTTGQELLSLIGHTNEVASVTFSPDGKQIASGSNDATVKVWNAITGQESFTLNGHTELVTSLAFSPDGKQIASGSKDGTMKIWDVMTGQESLSLNVPTVERDGRPVGIGCVAFSSDGKQLMAASPAGGTGFLRVWDARPWTTELRNEQRARAVCRHLFEYQKLSRNEGLDHILHDQTLTQQERTIALEFAKVWHTNDD